MNNDQRTHEMLRAILDNQISLALMLVELNDNYYGREERKKLQKQIAERSMKAVA